MGNITNENRRALEMADRYEDAVLSDMVENGFSAALCQLIEQKGVSVLSIVERSNISKSYINKLRNPSDKTVRPTRRVILDLALAVDATLDETNHLLKCAQYQELYARDRGESVIIWGMLKHYSGDQIREMLHEKELDIL